MNRYAPQPSKTRQRDQIERDVQAFIASGGRIQVLDHTHNQSWRHRERDKNNRFTRGDFSRL